VTGQSLKAVFRLSRLKEYTFFVTVTTLLGIAAAGGKFGWTFGLVLLANWLAVMFAFMINDVEDADDDALNPLKINRNPVSSGSISRRTALIVSFTVAIASAIIYSFLGFWPFVTGMISLILGFIYSWRVPRLKNIAFLDIASHCMMLAGLQFLPGYLAFENRPANLDWLFPFIFVTFVSMYGELFNEMRDLEGDLKAGLRHTGAVLGEKATTWLMMSVLAIGVVCGGITLLWLQIIHTWVVIVMAVAALLLIALPAWQAARQRNMLRAQESFQKPLEIAAAFALTLQFAWPWIWAIIAPFAGWLLRFKLF
jgi:4-hydroxybenzoate polyprenyltransferase